MGRPLPLVSLRAFAETGRLGSMKNAAETLGVTAGAVSQHVKLLEARLGMSLFERRNRELRLTSAGRRLLKPLTQSFARIEEAWALAERKRPGRDTLTVSTTASFAASWLVPRLGRFARRHPDIELRIETTSRLVDLRRDHVDVALRHGLGNYPGSVSIKFLCPQLVPLCSPKLLDRGPPVRAPRDCLAYPLLQESDRADWTLWLRSHGVVDPRASRGPSFTDDLLLVQAAVAGQGIALVRDIYGAEELASGRLVRVLELPWPMRFAYYIVMQPDRARQRKIAAFRTWLMDEARRP
ncbi:MAG TPA: transcriptional regulator GcvA [Alphaproteobacteria bacterium]|nr:transcriptional regulator GcvA [Alphaproteobacteria bacterium]